MTQILSAYRWTDNAAMIQAIASLGHLDGTVLDVTYGEGGFWSRFSPPGLVTSDLYKPADHAWDYRNLPCADGEFDVVVFDPPYKLNGTPAMGEMDDRYGVAQPKVSRYERMADIANGARECWRVAGKRLLVKVMDQVEGGRLRWQTDLVTETLVGVPKIERFDYLFTPRQQPGNRTQRTALRCYSTLLIFGERPRLSAKRHLASLVPKEGK